jgi:prophage regulatory protein
METDSNILRVPQVVELSGLCRASIYRLAKLGEFPSPIKLSNRAVGWRRSEILAWQAERAGVGDPRLARDLLDIEERVAAQDFDGLARVAKMIARRLHFVRFANAKQA